MRGGRVAAVSSGLVAVVSCGLTFGADDWKKAFDEKYTSANSWECAEAIAALDPTAPEQLKLILKIADGQKVGSTAADWYLRRQTALVLAKKADQGSVAAELLKIIAAGKPLGQAEVAFEALAIAGDERCVASALATLKGKYLDERLRLASVRALGAFATKASVAGLIELLEHEEKAKPVDPAHATPILESLERATHEVDKSTAADWRAWWVKAEADWHDKKPAAEGEVESGELVSFECDGTTASVRLAGKGTPLLVLPDLAYEPAYIRPYLRPLEASHLVVVVRLPGMRDFKNPELKPEGNSPNPVFPLDRMVQVVDQVRQQLVRAGKIPDKPVALFAHGMLAGWVAMRYAAKSPEKLSRLLLCSAQPDFNAFDRSMKAMEAAGVESKDVELQHLAQTMSLNPQTGRSRYEAASSEESKALSRKHWGSSFADATSLEIGRLLGPLVSKGAFGEYPRSQRLDMGLMIPKFDVAKEAPVNLAVLVMAGDAAFFGSVEDADDLKEHFSKTQREVFKKCSRMLFMEDSPRFLRVVSKFLR